jgi:hypothetical protein
LYSSLVNKFYKKYSSNLKVLRYSLYSNVYSLKKDFFLTSFFNKCKVVKKSFFKRNLRLNTKTTIVPLPLLLYFKPFFLSYFMDLNLYKKSIIFQKSKIVSKYQMFKQFLKYNKIFKNKRNSKNFSRKILYLKSLKKSKKN